MGVELVLGDGRGKEGGGEEIINTKQKQGQDRKGRGGKGERKADNTINCMCDLCGCHKRG